MITNLSKFIYKLPDDLLCYIIDFCDTPMILDVNDKKYENFLLNKYIKIKYSKFFDKMSINKRVPIDITNYLTRLCPTKINFVHDFCKKIKKKVLRNECYDIFIYFIKKDIQKGNNIKQISGDNITKLMNYFVKKNDIYNVLFSIQVLNYFNYEKVLIEACKLQKYDLLLHILDNYKSKITNYNNLINNLVIETCYNNDLHFCKRFMNNYFLGSKTDINIILYNITNNINGLNIINAYNILIYAIDELNLCNYSYMFDRLYRIYRRENKILLHKFILDNLTKINTSSLNYIIIEYKKNFLNFHDYENEHLFIYKDFNESEYKILKILLDYYKNNNFLNKLIEPDEVHDSCYMNLFQSFFISLHEDKQCKSMDDIDILNLFIKKIEQFESLYIYSSESCIRNNIKQLFVDIKLDEYYYTVNIDKIKRIRLLLIDFLYIKYKNYFDSSMLFIIDMIYHKQYYIIARMIKNGYNTHNNFYQYILSQPKSEEIIINIYKEGIDYKKTGQDIMFCKYYASKDSFNKIKYLSDNGFTVNEDIMNVALYNTSYYVVNYLYFEKNIKINDDGVSIIYHHLESNNNVQINFANHISKLCFV